MSQDPLSRCPQVQPHIFPHLPAAPWSPCPPTPAATQAARSSQGQRRASARGRAPGQSPLPRTCCHQPGTLHPASLTLCPQHMGHSGSPPRRATCSRSAAVTEKSQLVRGRGLPHTAGREQGPARPQPPRHRGKVCMPARASGCSEGHSGLGPHGQGEQFSVAALVAPGPEGVAVDPCSAQIPGGQGQAGTCSPSGSRQGHLATQAGAVVLSPRHCDPSPLRGSQENSAPGLTVAGARLGRVTDLGKPHGGCGKGASGGRVARKRLGQTLTPRRPEP